MSVLINMEMPTSCADCRFAVDGWCYACPPESKAEQKRITTNYCPLVPVPQHGRLIDADAVEKKIDYVANLDWNKEVGASGGMLAALGIVEDALTIIPADPAEEGET